VKNLLKHGFFVFALFTLYSLSSCENDNALLNGNLNFKAEESLYFSILRDQHSRLKLQAITGANVILGKIQNDSIIITGTKRVRSESIDDAEQHLSDLQVSMQNLGSEVIVSTSQPQHTQNRAYEVDYIINLPNNMAVYINAVTGSVTVTAMNDTVVIDHITGSVVVEESGGNAYVDLITGAIECDAIVPTNGVLDLLTVTGNINLTIPFNTSANFSANVTTGTIGLTNILLQNRVETDQSLSGMMGNGEGTITLRTITGDIAVTGL
jgi:hypothetical protein